MSKTRTLYLAAAAAVAALTIAPLTPAHAEDTRPCVSNREFWGLKWGTKAQIEKRWDVTGLGWRDPTFGAWAYPRCGFKPSDSWYGFVSWDHGNAVQGVGVYSHSDRASKLLVP